LIDAQMQIQHILVTALLTTSARWSLIDRCRQAMLFADSAAPYARFGGKCCLLSIASTYCGRVSFASRQQPGSLR
jgi:hypothetical protein